MHLINIETTTKPLQMEKDKSYNKIAVLINWMLLLLILPFSNKIQANLIVATPSNYTTYLSSLSAGDTLLLTAGNYTNDLVLNGLNGTVSDPIVIMGAGNSTVIQGRSCCNTVSIRQSSYLVIKNFKLDGLNKFVDAIKAEGTTGNWASHITIEYLTIEDYDADQQSVGISTKCPAWNWVIRKNVIRGAGTGMYLGNSDGRQPFVNGIIENNLIENTIGYNLQIKHQINGTRDLFPGTQVNAKTIIRHNVFTKDNSSSTGGAARPNLLVGAFPTTGWGTQDYYEIYSNFFYNNPVEALFQGTGKVTMYNNTFVNHFNPSGYRAVYFKPQNGISPQEINVFHNTVWTANTSGGIRLYSPDNGYQQYCYANAVFSPLAITGFLNVLDNVEDTYSNASNYVVSATMALNTLNLYPKSGTLTGNLTPSTLFQNNSDWDKDFNHDTYDWTYRGAYSGCCTNNGWRLQLDTMPCTPESAMVRPNICLWMEGAYDNNSMQTILLQKALLPVGHPYNVAPWNHTGTEGQGWGISDYPPNSVDWVKVGFRSGISSSSTVATAAAIVQSDGCLLFPNPNVLSTAVGSAFYIVIEHRNHLAVMTPTSIALSGTDLTYDFRSSDGYNNGSGFGQKEILPGVWAMYAGDGEQVFDVSGYEITGADYASWLPQNGLFNVYQTGDYNFDGEITGVDKIYWSLNNGIYSVVER